MGNIFLDTGFIIALVRSADENYANAKEIFARFNDSQFFISDHVLDETLTYLIKKGEVKTAYQLGKMLLGADQIELLLPSKMHLSDSLEIINKFHSFSLCDALSILLMKEHKVDKILSFDSDFDLVPGIERIF